MTTTPTTFDADDWRRRVDHAKAIKDPVERRKAYLVLVEEWEAAQAWVREMERDMDFLRGSIMVHLGRLETALMNATKQAHDGETRDD